MSLTFKLDQPFVSDTQHLLFLSYPMYVPFSIIIHTRVKPATTTGLNRGTPTLAVLNIDHSNPK